MDSVRISEKTCAESAELAKKEKASLTGSDFPSQLLQKMNQVKKRVRPKSAICG